MVTFDTKSGVKAGSVSYKGEKYVDSLPTSQGSATSDGSLLFLTEEEVENQMVSTNAVKPQLQYPTISNQLNENNFSNGTILEKKAIQSV